MSKCIAPTQRASHLPTASHAADASVKVELGRRQEASGAIQESPSELQQRRPEVWRSERMRCRAWASLPHALMAR